MIGKQQINSISRSLAPDISASVIEAVLLFLTGAFAMFLHAKLRIGISIPGHHGLDFMALLLAGRMVSKVKYSSIFMAMGIGVMIFLPFIGFKNPVSAMGYMLPVFIFDLVYSNLPKRIRKIWILSIIGGLSYMTVPLFRIILMAVTGMAYPAAVKYGTPFAPVAGFFLFGMLGSGFTASLVYIIKKYRK